MQHLCQKPKSREKGHGKYNKIPREKVIKVNKEKSAVDRVWGRKFLGFSFYLKKDEIRIRPHEKIIKRLKDKIREITNRNIGISMETRIKRLNFLIVGWVNYFKIADMKAKLN
ncbi:group II intron maturase-specific domain-containing protein [Caloranaerobacter azorensis]|uniref:group II intron maturase-specific domain-containing protein n=1 Tax=Caloranaerobacter azorensis TaxID=116090 RepID=UPI003D65FB3F